MTTRIDDRNEKQLKTHRWLVTATDSYMSGWGGASGGKSQVAWACRDLGQAQQVLTWVRSREEMKRVDLKNEASLARGAWYPQCAHLHIYVVTDSHPAIS